jgi:hypothetical protein
LRRDALDLVGRGGVGDELPRDRAQEVVGRDEGSGGRIEMIDVLGAQDAQRAARLPSSACTVTTGRAEPTAARRPATARAGSVFLCLMSSSPHWRQGPRTRLNRRPDIVVSQSPAMSRTMSTTCRQQFGAADLPG